MTGDTTPDSFWNHHYGDSESIASRPNPLLVEVASRLEPGHALDLACGAGGDSLWLAGRGWQVTAVDLAATAVDLLAGRAREADLAERIDARQQDLALGVPDGPFDLVSAQYFHTPFEVDRAAILRGAAAALRPGGLLLVVDHGSIAPWSWNQDPDTHFPTATELAAGLELDERWRVERADRPRREADGPGGQRAEVADTVLLVRRVR